MNCYPFLKCLFLLVQISLCCSYAQAQSNTDSLWQIWQDERIEKTERFDAFGDYIISKYINPSHELDTAILLAQQLEIEGKNEGKNCIEGRGVVLQASANLEKHNYLEAAKLYKESILKLKPCASDFSIENIYLNIGFCYSNIGLHNEAIDNYQKVLSFSEKLQNKDLESTIYINISRSYALLGQYQASLKYLQKAKTLNHNLEHIYLNLGGVYLDMRQYDSALVNIELAVEGNRKIDDQINLSRSLFELGRLKVATGSKEQGLEHYEAAIEIFKDLNAMPEIAMAYNDIGTIELNRNNFQESIKRCEAAKSIAIQFGLQEETRDACYCLYQNYYKLGNAELALKYLEDYHARKDSLINEKQIQELTTLEMNYAFDAERRSYEAQSELKQKEIDSQNRLNRWLIFGIVLSLISVGTLGFLLLQIRNRNQTIQKQHQQLTEKSTRLEELNQLKNRLFAIIGHDLRSPVGGLKSALDLLEDQTLSQQDFVEVMPSMQRNITAVYETLENLLFWAKSQIEGESIELTSVNLSKAVSETRDYLDTLLKEKLLSFDHSMSTPNEVKADKNLLNLVLRNLIGNAIKFTQPEGAIEVSSIRKNGKIEVAIKDTGVGIPPKRIATLFKDGTTTWGTSGEKGTGIGLMFCKEVIEKSGGQIWVESQVGEGSTFYFDLPVAR